MDRSQNDGNYEMFRWTDNSDFSFSNWAQGNPQKLSGYDCVQINADESILGKWSNDPCNRNNLVVCQKMQTWTNDHIQEILLNERRENIKIFAQIEENFLDVNKRLSNSLEQQTKLIPIGFIYVQLSGQSDPKSLWSTMEWTDVTTEYAGLFFRAEGGQSAKFGEIQAEGCSHFGD